MVVMIASTTYKGISVRLLFVNRHILYSGLFLKGIYFWIFCLALSLRKLIPLKYIYNNKTHN